MERGAMALFALEASRDFGKKVSAVLGIPLSAHEEREFEDGEHKARPLVSVRDQDVFVIQSLYSGPQHSVNDKLCRLLFFSARCAMPRPPASPPWSRTCVTHARTGKPRRVTR